MATLNLSSNGPAIKNSYQKVVDSPAPSGPAASPSTYGQWAVFTVQAPLASAFQNDSTKESVLRVQTTGEGELLDLIEEFSDGRIQFAFVKIKDSNSGLPKSVLIAWCGEGVPERTKGYFGSHLTAVSKLLHGYHVQITARSDRDLTPESILQKVADSSGSRYTGGSATRDSGSKPAPPAASKPVFMPTKSASAGGFAQLGSRSRGPAPSQNADSEGWGEDAPQVSRSQLEKVESAYKPTRVNMAELTSQKQAPSRFQPSNSSSDAPSDVVRGGYQPIGKVDLNAIRREARENGQSKDDRPTTVSGAYEPIGKVDIAAIRAKAQGGSSANSSLPSRQEPQEDSQEESPRPLADRSAAFQSQDRMTSLPKPKIANKFGGNSFTGTRAPLPGGTDQQTSSAAPVGVASRTFADQGGKTPAQQWAEKKARERGTSVAGDTAAPASVTSPVPTQKSGGWQSGYAGKKWNSVEVTKTGASHVSNNVESAPTEEAEEEDPQLNRFASGGRGVPLPLPVRSQPSGQRPAEEHIALPPPPTQPRSPTPSPPSSPVRIAMPVSRGPEPKPIITSEPEPIPIRHVASAVEEADPEPEPQATRDEPGRGAAQAIAESSFGPGATTAAPGAAVSGKRALIQYDYEKAEDNEIELREGEYVSNIEMVDEDWWMGQNSAGETGLFPSNYVELVGDEEAEPTGAHTEPVEHAAAPSAPSAAAAHGGQTATAQYDYEAAEDNEISFPEGAKITDLEFPDDDWWLGVYEGKQGLFPANYVELDQ